MEEFVLRAEPRETKGSRAARRLRAAGRLPANIYGHGEDNRLVSLDTKDFERFFEAGHRVARIEVAGGDEHIVVTEVQYDSLGSEPLHVDFTRIARDEKIVMEVPVEMVGVPKGVSSGGILEAPLHELKIEGFARRIPERYELRVEDLRIGDAIRLKDLVPPEGCAVVGDPELVVVHVEAPARAAPEEEAAAAAAPTEPEVVQREREEEPEAGS